MVSIWYCTKDGLCINEEHRSRLGVNMVRRLGMSEDDLIQGRIAANPQSPN